MTEKTAFQLLSSTRYDPCLTSFAWNDDEDGPSAFFLLPLHLRRLTSAAETHDWSHAKSLLDFRSLKAACSKAVAEQQSLKSNTSGVVLRIRITVSSEGHISVSASPLRASFTQDPMTVPVFESLEGDHVRVYVDHEPTTPSLFTKTKTTIRDMYDLAKARNESQLEAGPQGAPWDVLLYNERNQIMEVTIFNVAFWRSSRWITPSTRTGCLPGVLRQWLLDHERIFEDARDLLTRHSIQNGEWVLLFNGVQGVRLGKIYG